MRVSEPTSHSQQMDSLGNGSRPQISIESSQRQSAALRQLQVRSVVQSQSMTMR